MGMSTNSYEIWCRHFNGIQNKICKMGIAYDLVGIKRENGPGYMWPCFKDQGCTERCGHASFLSPEEVAEKEREASEALQRYLTNMANDICPQCERPIEEKKQVGRCVYSWPCGHRLYQGTLPKKEKSIEDHPFFREQAERLRETTEGN